MALKIIWNDITKERCDVLVTPPSRECRVGSGMDAAVHAAAGEELLAARSKYGYIGPGDVWVTDAFGLKGRVGAKFVIHALGPLWEGGAYGEALILEGVYLKILAKVVALKCRTVALPVLSSGRFGMPMKDALEVAVTAIEEFLEGHKALNVKLVGIDTEFYDIAKADYPDQTESHFTKAEEGQYRQAHGKAVHKAEAFVDDEPLEYFKTVKRRLQARETSEVARGKTANQIFSIAWNAIRAADRVAKKRPRACSRRPYLCRVEDLAPVTGISLRNLKHYLSGSENRRPPRECVLLLALALHLDRTRTEAVLQLCDYPKWVSDRDLHVLAAIERGALEKGRALLSFQARGIVICLGLKL